MSTPRVLRSASPLVAVVLLFGAGAAPGEQPSAGTASPSSRRPRTYGTLDQVAYRISSPDFITLSSTTPWEFDTAGGEAPSTRRYSTLRLGEFIGPTHLPTGALVEGFELDYCDADQVGEVVRAFLEVYDKNGAIVQSLLSLTSNNDGCSLVYDTLATPYEVQNATQDLIVRVITGSGDPGNSFSGVTIFYSLQMSPAPPTQTFSDVPDTYLFFRVIEAMARSGITVGCGTGIYCPDQNVTRGEMAAFFVRALGLHFPDVPPGP